MKKQFSEATKHKIRASIKKFERRVLRKGKERSTNNKINTDDGSFLKLEAPANISIYSPESDSYKATLLFIKKIDNRSDERNIYLDFRNTLKVTAAAIAMIYAAVENKMHVGIDIYWKIGLPNNRDARRILRQSHLVKLIEGSEIEYDFKKMDIVPIVSGKENEYVDDFCEYVNRKYYRDGLSEIESAEKDQILGSALQETIENVGFHAYKQDEELKKWWLRCAVIEDYLYLVIYDRGVGIHETVYNKEWFSDAAKKLCPEVYSEIKKVKGDLSWHDKIRNNFTDQQLIQISMFDDFSATLQSNRGQGSKSIKKLVSDSLDGNLLIYSGSGLYKFTEEDKDPELIALPKPIDGTLVQWNIKI